MPSPSRRAIAGLVTLAATGTTIGTTAAAANATSTPKSEVPAVSLHLFAKAPAHLTAPDDITKLGNEVFIAYQNNAGKDGTPAGSFSVVIGYDIKTAKVLDTFKISGRVDGMAADMKHHRIFASVNEDLNSSLYVITPGEDASVKHFTYSPDPAQTGTDGKNGGTDSISIGSDGTAYVSHSNPDVALPAPNNTAAVYKIRLKGTSAELTPIFGVNDIVPVINPAAGAPKATAMGLTDPDSNRFIPGRDGGTLIQVAQADSKLVFVTDLKDKHPVVKQLNLTNAVIPSTGDATTTPQIDDVEKVSGKGTLFVVDQATGDTYTIDTANVDPGTYFVSQPASKAGDQPNDAALGVVNLKTGVVTHVATSLVSPKGLLFVPAARGHEDDGDR